MGCDIHSHAEVRKNGQWEKVGKIFPDMHNKGKFLDEPFCYRNYNLFAFLSNVRNGYDFQYLGEPKHSIPWDSSDEVKEDYESWKGDAHSHNYFTLEEFLDFNYKKIMPINIGPGYKLTYKKMLGPNYFKTLKILGTLGDPQDVRVIFWFDN